MAIANVAEYAHLSEADLEALGCELDAMRRDIEESRGETDRAYIQRVIAFQRCLDVAARLVIAGSRSKAGWGLGTTALAVDKCIENMELGHNICHGSMGLDERPGNPPPAPGEWDMAGVSSQWRYSHNYSHHVFTNVIGMDDADTASCGSPATGNGGAVICCSLYETCCRPSCSNGHRAAGLGVPTRRPAPRKPPSPERWSAR